MRKDEILFSDKTVILDGAMGTMLQEYGYDISRIPYDLNINAPDDVIAIHRAYVDAGADIIYANTFSLNGLNIKDGNLLYDAVAAGVQNAVTAAGKDALVALDIGPLGQAIEPLGDLTEARCLELFEQQVEAGKNADIIVIETMMDISEAEIAAAAAKKADKPVFLTMSFEKNMRSFYGVSIKELCELAERSKIDAVGVNCSVGPDVLAQFISEFKKYTDLPLILKPNAGMPDPSTGAYDVTAEYFAQRMLELSRMGVRYIGGCCGTTPEFVAEIRRLLA